MQIIQDMGWKRRAFLEQREAELAAMEDGGLTAAATNDAGDDGDDMGQEVTVDELMEMFFSEDTSESEDGKQGQAVDEWYNARRKWNNDVLFAPLPGQQKY